MPHLTLPVGATGPVLDLIIGVSEPRRDALRKAGQPVPDALKIRGLIDTGASGVMIDRAHLATLKISPTGRTHVHTPSTGTTQNICLTYDVMLGFNHPKLAFRIGTHAVMASDLTQTGVDALIGRDVLEHCLLVYDGVNATFTIAF